MLGRKASLTRASYTDFVTHVGSRVPRAMLDSHVDDAVRRIAAAQSRYGARFGVAWSGGKDSIAVTAIAEMAGVSVGVQACADPSLEYQSFVDWCDKHRPSYVRTDYPGMTPAWLRKNPRLVFPSRFKDSARIHTLYNGMKWTAQRALIDSENLAFIVTGRRTIDSNFCGTGGVSTARGKYVSVSPLYDWSHELVFALIHYHGLALPPVYDTEHGFAHGARPWPLTSLDEVLERQPDIYARWKPEIDHALAQGIQP